MTRDRTTRKTGERSASTRVQRNRSVGAPASGETPSVNAQSLPLQADGDGNDRSRERRSTDFVQSLDRGLSVIRVFSKDNPAPTLSEIARETNLTRPTARRILLTLQALGYISLNGRRFSLTPRVLELGYSYLSTLNLWELAQPHMLELVSKTRESSSAAILDGTEVVYVARVPTSRIMAIALTVASRLPAYATSMGRILLAHLDEDSREEILEKTELVPLTDRTIVDRDQLRAILAEAKTRGWTLVDQELEFGVRSIAAPLRGATGDVIAALNISAHAGRVSIERMTTEFVPLLVNAAAQISRELAKRF